MSSVVCWLVFFWFIFLDRYICVLFCFLFFFCLLVGVCENTCCLRLSWLCFVCLFVKMPCFFFNKKKCLRETNQLHIDMCVFMFFVLFFFFKYKKYLMIGFGFCFFLWKKRTHTVLHLMNECFEHLMFSHIVFCILFFFNDCFFFDFFFWEFAFVGCQLYLLFCEKF